MKNVTPTVLYALIEVMTSQELINNLNAINKRGASKNIEIQKLIKSKLHTAKTDKNVSALKSSVAAKASNLSRLDLLMEIMEYPLPQRKIPVMA